MDETIQLLIVDDDLKVCELLKEVFTPPHYQTVIAQTKDALFDAIEAQYFNVILLDLYLGEDNGADLLKEIKKNQSKTEVIMMTGNGSIETAVEAMRLGAHDYLTKPFKTDELETRVLKAYERSQLSTENERLKKEIEHNTLFPEIIGTSTEIKDLLAQAQKVASTDAPVLILGESGTGKELLARAIHQISPRSKQPFVAINCSNLEKQLLESELFGYVKGAFTGADGNKPGLFECADNGTFFIDEIADMDIAVQPKLLRMLETQEFRRLGDNRTQKVDVRVIAATHKNLKTEIEKGNFREDLYYRLNVVELEIPPLRKRKEDIPLLIRHFLQNKKTQGNASIMDSQAIKTLLQYHFPGNIRELRNIIERASILTSSTSIQTEDLPNDIQDQIKGKSAKKTNLDDFVSNEEKQYIQQILLECQGNKTQAAKALGISRRNLYRKLDVHQL